MRIKEQHGMKPLFSDVDNALQGKSKEVKNGIHVRKRK